MVLLRFFFALKIFLQLSIGLILKINLIILFCPTKTLFMDLPTPHVTILLERWLYAKQQYILSRPSVSRQDFICNRAKNVEFNLGNRHDQYVYSIKVCYLSESLKIWYSLIISYCCLHQKLVVEAYLCGSLHRTCFFVI